MQDVNWVQIIASIVVAFITATGSSFFLIRAKQRREHTEADSVSVQASEKALGIQMQTMNRMKEDMEELQGRLDSQGKEIKNLKRTIGAYKRNQTIFIKAIKESIQQLEDNGITPNIRFEKLSLEAVDY